MAKSRELWAAVQGNQNAECQLRFLRALNDMFKCGYTVNSCPTLNLAVDLILETGVQAKTEPAVDSTLSTEDSSSDVDLPMSPVKSEVEVSPITPNRRVTRSVTSAMKSPFPLPDNYAPCHILVRVFRYLTNEAATIGMVGNKVSICKLRDL